MAKVTSIIVSISLLLMAFFVIPTCEAKKTYYFVNVETEPAETETYYINGTFEAGSVVIIGFEWAMLQLVNPPLTPIYVEWALYDADGRKIYEETKKAQYELYYAGVFWGLYVNAKNEITIPNMWFKKEGIFTVRVLIKDKLGVSLPAGDPSKLLFKFYVKKGGFLANLFAPIYLYEEVRLGEIPIIGWFANLFKLGWVEVGNFRLVIPSTFLVVAPLLALIGFIIYVMYVKGLFNIAKKLLKKKKLERRGIENV